MDVNPKVSAKKTSKLEETRNDLTAQIEELNEFLEVENDADIFAEVENFKKRVR